MSAAIGYVTGSGSATSLSDPLVKILWSDKLHVQTLNELFFTERGMTAPEQGDEETFERRPAAPIIVKDDFSKSRGQRIRLALRLQLTSNSDRSSLDSHTYSSETMVGNEEVMELYDMECLVELLKNATAFDTPEIQSLRTNFRMDVQARDALGDWMRDQKEEGINDAFVDGNAAHVIATTLKSSDTHPNIKYGVSSDNSSNDDLDAGDTLSVALLRRMYGWARQNKINPVRDEGQEAYCLLAPVSAVNDLDADSEYRDSMNNAGPRAWNNPMFSRAEKKFGGVFVHEYERLRSPTHANSANIFQCMLIGAHSVVLGNADKPRLVRRKEDEYEDRYGVGIKHIFGCARADFVDRTDATTINQSSAQWNVWAEGSY